MATSTIKKQLKLQTYEGIATTDSTGDFVIPSGIVNPNNGAMCKIDTRQLQTVILMTAAGQIIDRQTIGKIADDPDPEPTPEPEPEEA